MTPRTDPLELLAGLRPTDVELGQAWPAGQRTAMRESIRADESAAPILTSDVATEYPHRKQWAALAGLVGAAAAALLVVQLSPSHTPAGQHATPGAGRSATVQGSARAASASLEQLALAAQASKAAVLQPGQFLHVVNSRHVVNGDSSGSDERWIAYDGRSWAHITGPQVPSPEYFYFPADPARFQATSITDASGRFLATLPTDPAQLNDYLVTHLCTSTSLDRAVFGAAQGILSGNIASPALRAAMFRVLKGTGHFTTRSTRDSQGHDALAVELIDESLPGQSDALLFDPTTSALLEEVASGPEVTTVVPYDPVGKAGTRPAATHGPIVTHVFRDDGVDEIVANVPADVLAKAVIPDDGPPTSAHAPEPTSCPLWGDKEHAH